MEFHLNKKSYSESGKNKGTSHQLQLASLQSFKILYNLGKQPIQLSP